MFLPPAPLTMKAGLVVSLKVFTPLEYGMCGLTEEQCKEKCRGRTGGAARADQGRPGTFLLQCACC